LPTNVSPTSHSWTPPVTLSATKCVSNLFEGQPKSMLPMLATMVAGFMARQAGAGGGTGGGLRGMLGGLLGGSRKSSGSGMAGILSMLDADGDGNPLDDIMGMMGKK